MRPVLHVAFASFLLAVLAGCVPQPGGIARPNPIIVREFTFSPGVITLDPSFGFSLYRGSPGVPPRQRAAGVGRAAAFNLADAVTEELAASGYDAIRSNDAVPEPGARALIVSGAFRHIDEGRRRRVGAENPSIAIDAAIDYQIAGAAPQRVTELHLDSRQVPRGGITGVSMRRGVDANLAATRVGAAIARTVIETARLNNWPTASR